MSAAARPARMPGSHAPCLRSARLLVLKSLVDSIPYSHHRQPFKALVALKEIGLIISKGRQPCKAACEASSGGLASLKRGPTSILPGSVLRGLTPIFRSQNGVCPHFSGRNQFLFFMSSFVFFKNRSEAPP